MRTSLLVLMLCGTVLATASAARGAWEIALPEGAAGYKFGNLIVAPLKNVTNTAAYDEAAGFGFAAVKGLAQGEGQWPDALSGSYVLGPAGEQVEFQAKLPNGDYLVYLLAGMVIRDKPAPRRFLLKVNDKALCDESPAEEDLAGEKYLYRFMWTQYSQRPHAIWENYIARMYPAVTGVVKVTDGMLRMTAVNHFLSAVIAVPAARKAEFEKLTDSIRQQRMEAFEKTLKPITQPAPARSPTDGDYVVFIPRDREHIMPWTAPTETERKGARIATGAARGQHVLMVIAVTPFADLGPCSLALSDLEGPGRIPASAIRGHFRNYRFNGKDLGEKGQAMDEMALLPRLKLDVEAGVTQSFWLWLKVPDDAAAGAYKGKFTFAPEKAGAKATEVPVELEVYPFRLVRPLPVAYGFWGTGYDLPAWPAELKRKIVRDRLAWMVDTGFTSITVPGPSVKELRKPSGVEMVFNPMWFELAKEVGMAARPEQPLLDGGLMATVGRQIGSRLPGSRSVYNKPGIELLQPEFRGYFLDAVRQYRDFIAKMGLPTVVTSVDEPREYRINSWNRNLPDTLAYCDMMKEGGLTVCCDPMYDKTHGKDYTPLIDHVDVLSTHAWDKSKLFMRQTLEKKKVLWLYNCGKDRYSWGFYNWRAQSTGRWEWHFCWAEDDAAGGYPGREWYNPFTGLHGLAPSAPHKEYPGAILYQSDMLNMADGITDYAYVHTLSEALKKDYAGSADKAAAAKEAADFLAALRRAMPEFPEVKGLASDADGPAVGMGIQDEARLHAEEWRAKIAGYLKRLAP